jgi:hypothetical protein
MPNLPSAVAASVGVAAALAMGTFTFVFENVALKALVYNTYGGLVAPGVQLFEVAWLLATIDQLLDLSVMWSFLLWIVFPVVAALTVRKPAGVFKIVATGVLVPAGTWLLFAYKYIAVGGLAAAFLPFLMWRLFMTLCLVAVTAAVLVFPFWLRSHLAFKSVKTPRAIRFACQKCGAEYNSNPVVCVRCGAEGAIREVE